MVVILWTYLLCFCPRSITSCEVPRLLREAAKAHAHTTAECGWGQRWERWIKSSPSNSGFVLLPGSKHHVASAVTNGSWTALPNSWSVSCKSLKTSSSLAHPLCHVLQHTVQIIPRDHVDAADELSSVMLVLSMHLCRPGLTQALCFPLKAYEPST